jgi:hypothetical protein
MIAEISAAFASVRAIQDIAKVLLAVRDGAKIEAAVSEINTRLLHAQGSIFAVNEKQQVLLDENRGLRDETAALKNWDQEKSRYELRAIQDGPLVYCLKADQDEPPHSLCPNCFAQARKSILQSDKLLHNMAERLVCYDCDFNVYVRGSRVKDHPPHKAGRR